MLHLRINSGSTGGSQKNMHGSDKREQLGIAIASDIFVSSQYAQEVELIESKQSQHAVRVRRVNDRHLLK